MFPGAWVMAVAWIGPWIAIPIWYQVVEREPLHWGYLVMVLVGVGLAVALWRFLRHPVGPDDEAPSDREHREWMERWKA
jgi:hypothetical protein